jgi:iron(III) transport system ATP-binding protein
LTFKGVPEAEARRRAEEAARLVHVAELLERMPPEMSGGQQQRVALARALVKEPQLLLLDEPLSNLDAKLRDAMRTELKRLQREFNLTTVYVTHDQSEALALSHEIAVMSDGCIVQIGSPRQIYEQPANQFVADFVGQTNFIRGTVAALDSDGRARVVTGIGEMKVHAADGVVRDAAVVVSVRPEDLELSEREFQPGADDNVIRAIVHAKDFLGEYLDFQVKVGDVVLQARAHPSLRTPTGDPIFVRMQADKCVAIRSDSVPPEGSGAGTSGSAIRTMNS